MRNPRLDDIADELSDEFEAPVVIVVGGTDGEEGPDGTNFGSSEDRMRDRLGLLQAAIQMDAFDHLVVDHVLKPAVMDDEIETIEDVAEQLFNLDNPSE